MLGGPARVRAAALLDRDAPVDTVFLGRLPAPGRPYPLARLDQGAQRRGHARVRLACCPTVLPSPHEQECSASSAGFAGAILRLLASDGGAPAPRRPPARTASGRGFGRGAEPPSDLPRSRARDADRADHVASLRRG